MESGDLLSSNYSKKGVYKLYQKFFKRFFDLLIAIAALPFFGILYVFIAPIIHFSDNGSVFYNAKRIGRNGRLFTMYKFRTMYENAPDIRLADGSTYNGADDPRVTKIGKFLRATSIDEIPQILNMLNGTMSLIGPRPDPPDWIDRYPEDIRVFLTVRPGLTGYCQAYWRNGADGEEKMKADAFYATHLSFLFDVKIFFKSILTVIGHSNTYKDLSAETEVIKEVKEVSAFMAKPNRSPKRDA